MKESFKQRSHIIRVVSLRGLLLAIALFFPAIPCLSETSTYALIVSGASGNEEFKTKFWDWSTQMIQVLSEEMKISKDHVLFLTEDPTRDPSLRASKASKVEMTKTLASLLSDMKDRDRLLILLLGHGSADDSQYKFNLVGPDITGSELKSWLDRFERQQIAFISTTPCSGGLTKILSGPNRVIITATKSEFENNDTIFAKFFVEAFKGNQADVDKNGRVSLLEAYVYANQRVEAWYKEDGRLATEHSMLDDNGDQMGVAHPSAANGEGLLAGKISFGLVGVSDSVQDGAELSPELRVLTTSKQQIEGAIQDLKYKKATLPEAEYSAQMETLLIQLAQTNQKINVLKKK